MGGYGDEISRREIQRAYRGKSAALSALQSSRIGIRGGEVLSLCTTDIDWDRCQIVIALRPDERTDRRQRQPLVKTLDRRIPLGDELVDRLHTYIVTRMGPSLTS